MVIRTNVMKNNSDSRLALHSLAERLILSIPQNHSNVFSRAQDVAQFARRFNLTQQSTVMSDFHIVALKYRLQLSDHISYAKPPPLVFETEAAHFHLENNQLRCDMKLHAATS